MSRKSRQDGKFLSYCLLQLTTPSSLEARRLTMARPFGSRIDLASDVHAKLHALVRADSTPQALVFRCRIILRAGQRDDPSNLQIANELGCDRHTVGQW